MKKWYALVLVLVCLPSLTFASDAVDKGTLQLAGSTSVAVSKQTLTGKDANGKATGADSDLTSTNFGVNLAYYITKRFAIGATANHQKVELKQGTDVLFNTVGGNFGGALTYRIPMSAKADFVLTGSGGVAQVRINQTQGGVDASGPFYQGSGTVSVLVSSRASLDFGVGYQKSAFTQKPASNGKFDAAGLSGGVGFSIYFNGR